MGTKNMPHPKMLNKKHYLWPSFCLLTALHVLSAQAAELLPPGIPRTVNTNGETIGVDFRFTTPQYEATALIQDSFSVPH